MRLITAVAAALLLAACTAPGSERTSSSATIEERVFTVAGASGFDGPWIEFATRDRGYAMFTSCGPDGCKALLFGTEDGGTTWKVREHPQPVAKNQQMYVACGPATVVLLSEPDAWYVTHDGAMSWQRSAYVMDTLPPEYPIGDGGRFYVDDGETLRDRQEPQARRQVPEGARWLTNTPGNVLWLAGEVGGAPQTWISRSGPDNWQPVAVPRQEGRPVMAARVAVSADGKDTWLIADPEPVDAAGGGTLRARGSLLKPTGVPLIWRLSNDSWVPVPTADLEEKPAWSYAAAPAGDGLLLITGPDGLAHLRERVVLTAQQPRLGWVTQLDDGTVAGPASNGEAMYLSSGAKPGISWTKVVLSH